MTLIGWLQILLFCGIVLALVKPLGGYMTRVFSGERTLLSPLLVPVERSLYALAGTSERDEQHWSAYAVSMLLFNLAGFLLLYALLRLHAGLPYNPAGMGAVPADLSFNTAVSFVTNTNWQNYGAWQEAGGKDALDRATLLWQQALHEYEEPQMDPAIREELDAYVARRREEIGSDEP